MNVAGRSAPLSDIKRVGTNTGSGSAGIASMPSLSSSDVDMYTVVPSFELGLDEFEEYALARLKVRIAKMNILELTAIRLHVSISSRSDEICWITDT